MSVKDDIDAAYVNTMYRAQLRIAIRDEVFAEVRSRALGDVENLLINTRGTYAADANSEDRIRYALCCGLLEEIFAAEREGRPMSVANVDEIAARYRR